MGLRRHSGPMTEDEMSCMASKMLVPRVRIVYTPSFVSGVLMLTGLAGGVVPNQGTMVLPGPYAHTWDVSVVLEPDNQSMPGRWDPLAIAPGPGSAHSDSQRIARPS